MANEPRNADAPTGCKALSDNLGVRVLVNKHSESTGLHVELFLRHVTGQEWMCVKEVIAMWKKRHGSEFGIAV